MKLDRSFIVPIDEVTARKRTQAFFTLIGYDQISNTGQLYFKRGSAVGSSMSFNPSNWKCNASVYIKPGQTGAEVTVFYNVGSDPLEESIARELWLDESDCLRKAVVENDFTPRDIKAVTRKVLRNLLYVIGLVAALLVSAAIAAWAGIYIYNNKNIASVNSGIIASGVFIALTCAIFYIWNRVRPKYRRL